MPATRPMTSKVNEVSARTDSSSRKSSRGRPRWGGVVRALIVLGLLGGTVAGAAFGLAQLETSKKETEDSASEALGQVVGTGYADVPGGTTDLRAKIVGHVLYLGPSEGMVLEEGQKVEKGAVLVQLDDEDAQLKLDTAEVALKEAEVQLALVKSDRSLENATILVKLAEDTPKDFDLKIRQQEKSIAASEAEIKGYQARMDKLKRLRSINQARDDEVEMVEAIVDAQRKKIEAQELMLQDLKESERYHKLGRKHQIEKAKLALEQIEKTHKLQIQYAEQAVARLRIQVKQAKHYLSQHKIRAPYTGFVLRRFVNVGDSVAPTSPTPALIFCGNEPLIVRAEIDQEWAHLVKVGDSVIVQDDARYEDKAKKVEWTGKVTRLSRWFEKRRAVFAEPREMNDVRTMEAIVTFDKNQQDLPQILNQRVQVRVNIKGEK